jgi:acyl-coenzyme A thioesterase PaaI-like protein
MPESFQSRVRRHLFNLFPAYRGTGGRVAYISADWCEVHVRIPLNLRTRNYVGTIFGGSMYGAVDPIYMLMLIQALGPDYVVWDKAASIRFRRPGRTTLHARFVLTPQELSAIRTALRTERSIDRVYTLEITDAEGTVHATVEKTLYVRRKDARRE